MSDKIYKKLPATHQTAAVKNFFENTVEQLFSKSNTETLSGYVGTLSSSDYNADDVYISEPSAERARYSLEPTVNSINSDTGESENTVFFQDFLNAMSAYGANVDAAHRMFEERYYSFVPPIDVDKFLNYHEYFWSPDAPNAITITGTVGSNIDVAANIVGANSFVSGNNVELKSGMVINFGSNVEVGSYTANSYVVEGVGSSIVLVDADRNTSVPFLEGNTTQSTPDYMLIQRGSNDQSAWSRANHWYHISNFTDADMGAPDVSMRAQRPIIEFDRNLEMFNQGNLSVGTATISAGSAKISELEGEPSGILLDNVPLVSNVTVIFPNESLENSPYIYNITENSNGVVIPGAIGTVTISSALSGIDANVYYSVTGSAQGRNQLFDVTVDANSVVTVDIINPGRNFRVNDVINISGAELGNIDAGPLLLTVSSLDSNYFENGHIGNLSVDPGDANRNSGTYRRVTVSSTTGSGTDEVIDITLDVNGVVTDFDIVYGGRNHAVGDVLTISDPAIIGSGTNIALTVSELTQYIQFEEISGVITENQTVTIRNGKSRSGYDYYIDGEGSWVIAQQKTSVNQAPLFQLYDSTGVSLSDENVYNNTNFEGNPLFSYKVGTGTNDTVLGFPLSYETYKNLSEIVFENSIQSETYNYLPFGSNDSIDITGYYFAKKQNAEQIEYINTWRPSSTAMPVLIKDSFLITQQDVDEQKTIWAIAGPPADGISSITVMVNGVASNDFVYVSDMTAIQFNNFTFTVDDVIEISVNTDVGLTNKDASNGRYQVPGTWCVNCGKTEILEVSEPEYIEHFRNLIAGQGGITGNPLGVNNFKDTAKDTSKAVDGIQAFDDLTFAAYLIGNEKFNIIEAIRFCGNEYQKFKNRLNKQISDYVNKNDVSLDNLDMVLDEILRDVSTFSVGKKVFDNTYMMAFGDDYVEEEITINNINDVSYDLASYIDIADNKNTVLVYQITDTDKTLLIEDSDYTVTDNNGVLTLDLLVQTDWTLDDTVLVRLYGGNRESAQVPPTPSAMGMYPVFKPEIIIDDTFQTPITVIVGHDGSRTPAKNSAADQLLLEFEKRVYNNISKKFKDNSYRPFLTEFNIRPGFFRSSKYSHSDWYDLLRNSFNQYVAKNNLDFVTNEFSKLSDGTVNQNEFTWNFQYGTNMPGHWRGIYEYYYDTATPNTTPWEMLGFAEKPIWWNTNYGTDYSSNNTAMWADIEQGKIIAGEFENVSDLSYLTDNPYRRIGLSAVLPVDSNADIVSPSAILSSYSVENIHDNWKFGDGAPVENAWKYSESYAFALVEALFLAKPGLWVTAFAAPDRLVTLPVDSSQWVDSTTGSRLKLSTVDLHGDTDDAGDFVVASGFSQMIYSYIKFSGLNPITDFIQPFKTVSSKLGHKFAGFVDADTLSVFTDSYSPTGTRTSLLLPEEDIQISLHTGRFTSSDDYTGVMIELSPDGDYIVKGYNRNKSYFTILPVDITGPRNQISVAGDPVDYTNYVATDSYLASTIVRSGYNYYQAKVFVPSSTAVTDTRFWQRLPSLPQRNAANATLYLNSKSTPEKVDYFTKFSTIQEVVNFLVGLGRYQSSLGFNFGEYDVDINDVRDWVYAAKQFLFWSKGGWAAGNTLRLSPLANTVTFESTYGHISEITEVDQNQFSLLDQDGRSIRPQECEIVREDNRIQITAPQGVQIFGVTLHTEEIEHIMLINNVTIFNDVISRGRFNIRQGRLRIKGKRAGGWNGKLSTQGYMVIGDQLKPNFDTLASTMARYNESNFDPVESQVYDVARSQYGFQRRINLRDLGLVDQTQYSLYQGLIRNKGTIDSIEMIGNSNEIINGNITVTGEWAVKLGDFGDVDNQQKLDIKIGIDELESDPQLISLITPQSTTGAVSKVEVIIASTQFYAPPILKIQDPSNSTGSTATASVVLGQDGIISGVTVTNAGSGYVNNPSVEVITGQLLSESLETTFDLPQALSTQFVANSGIFTGGNVLSNLVLVDHQAGSSNVNVVLSSAENISSVVSAVNSAFPSGNIVALAPQTGDEFLLSITGSDFTIVNADSKLYLTEARYQPTQKYAIETANNTVSSDITVTIDDVIIGSGNWSFDEGSRTTIAVPFTTTSGTRAFTFSPKLPSNPNASAGQISSENLIRLNNEYRYVDVLVNGIKIEEDDKNIGGNVSPLFTLTTSGGTDNTVTFLDVARLPSGGLFKDDVVTVVEKGTIEFNTAFQGDLPGSTLKIKVNANDILGARTTSVRTFEVSPDIRNDEVITLDVDDPERVLGVPSDLSTNGLWPMTTSVDYTGIINSENVKLPNSGYVNPDDVQRQVFDLAALHSAFSTSNDPSVVPDEDDMIHMASALSSDWDVYRLANTGVTRGTIEKYSNQNTVFLYTNKSLLNEFSSNINIATGVDKPRFIDGVFAIQSKNSNNTTYIDDDGNPIGTGKLPAMSHSLVRLKNEIQVARNRVVFSNITYAQDPEFVITTIAPELSANIVSATWYGNTDVRAARLLQADGNGDVLVTTDTVLLYNNATVTFSDVNSGPIDGKTYQIANLSTTGTFTINDASVNANVDAANLSFVFHNQVMLTTDSNHSLSLADPIRVMGSNIYNGFYKVTAIPSNTSFVINSLYNGSRTGFFVNDRLVITTQDDHGLDANLTVSDNLSVHFAEPKYYNWAYTVTDVPSANTITVQGYSKSVSPTQMDLANLDIAPFITMDSNRIVQINRKTAAYALPQYNIQEYADEINRQIQIKNGAIDRVGSLQMSFLMGREPRFGSVIGRGQYFVPDNTTGLSQASSLRYNLNNLNDNTLLAESLGIDVVELSALNNGVNPVRTNSTIRQNTSQNPVSQSAQQLNTGVISGSIVDVPTFTVDEDSSVQPTAAQIAGKPVIDITNYMALISSADCSLFPPGERDQRPTVSTNTDRETPCDCYRETDACVNLSLVREFDATNIAYDLPAEERSESASGNTTPGQVNEYFYTFADKAGPASILFNFPAFNDPFRPRSLRVTQSTSPTGPWSAVTSTAAARDMTPAERSKFLNAKEGVGTGFDNSSQLQPLQGSGEYVYRSGAITWTHNPSNGIYYRVQIDADSPTGTGRSTPFTFTIFYPTNAFPSSAASSGIPFFVQPDNNFQDTPVGRFQGYAGPTALSSGLYNSTATFRNNYYVPEFSNDIRPGAPSLNTNQYQNASITTPGGLPTFANNGFDQQVIDSVINSNLPNAGLSDGILRADLTRAGQVIYNNNPLITVTARRNVDETGRAEDIAVANIPLCAPRPRVKICGDKFVKKDDAFLINGEKITLSGTGDLTVIAQEINSQSNTAIATVQTSPDSAEKCLVITNKSGTDMVLRNGCKGGVIKEVLDFTLNKSVTSENKLFQEDQGNGNYTYTIPIDSSILDTSGISETQGVEYKIGDILRVVGGQPTNGVTTAPIEEIHINQAGSGYAVGDISIQIGLPGEQGAGAVIDYANIRYDNNGGLLSVPLLSGGEGYRVDNPPTVIIKGAGSGAVATARLSHDSRVERPAKFEVTQTSATTGAIIRMKVVDRGRYKVFPADLDSGVPLEYDVADECSDSGVGTLLFAGQGRGARVFLTSRELPDCSTKSNALQDLGLNEGSVGAGTVAETLSDLLNQYTPTENGRPLIFADVVDVNPTVQRLVISAPDLDELDFSSLDPSILDILGLPVGSVSVDLIGPTVIPGGGGAGGAGGGAGGGNQLIIEDSNLVELSELSAYLPGADGRGESQVFQYECRDVLDDSAITASVPIQDVNVFAFDSHRFRTESDLTDSIANYANAWIDNYQGNGWAYLESGEIKRKQEPLVNIDQIKDVIVSEQDTGNKIADLWLWDPFKGVIPGVITKEITYITERDPVVYNTRRTRFGADQVGQTWWDISKVRYQWYEQGPNINYGATGYNNIERKRNWGKVFPGSTIDIYEWVQSAESPENYTGSGTPKNTSEFVSVKYFDSRSNSYRNRYYFWVKNKTTLENESKIKWNRNISVAKIASYLTNPVQNGLSLFAPISPDSMIGSNLDSVLQNDGTVLSVEYLRNKNTVSKKQSSWQLIRQGDINSRIPQRINDKLIDSLCGENAQGDAVPDPGLSNFNKIGISVRPRQSMFLEVGDARYAMWVSLNNMFKKIKIADLNSNWFNSIVNNRFVKVVNWYEQIGVDNTTNQPLYYDNSYRPSRRVKYAEDLNIISDVRQGMVVEVKETPTDNFKLYEYDISTNSFKLIAQQNATIELLPTVYESSFTAADAYDLRLLLTGLRDEVLVGENKLYWNELFFDMLQHAYSEQGQLIWAFKTSYLYVTKNEQDLIPIKGFRGDTFDKVLEYINEAKPYNSKVRTYEDIKSTPPDIMSFNFDDFDLPPYYDADLRTSRILDITATAESSDALIGTMGIIRVIDHAANVTFTVDFGNTSTYSTLTGIFNNAAQSAGSEIVGYTNTTNDVFSITGFDFEISSVDGTTLNNMNILADRYTGTDYGIVSTDPEYDGWFNNRDLVRTGNVTIVFDRVKHLMYENSNNSRTTGWLSSSVTLNNSIANNIVLLNSTSVDAVVDPYSRFDAADKIYKTDAEVIAATENVWISAYGSNYDANLTVNVSVVANQVASGNFNAVFDLISTKVGGDLRVELRDAGRFTVPFVNEDSGNDYGDAETWDTFAWDDTLWDQDFVTDNYEGIFDVTTQGPLNYRVNNQTVQGFDANGFLKSVYGPGRPEELAVIEPLENLLVTVLTANVAANVSVNDFDSTSTGIVYTLNAVNGISNTTAESQGASNSSPVAHRWEYTLFGETEIYKLPVDAPTDLAQNLNSWDTEISLVDSGSLPFASVDSPGYVWIGKEKIMYTSNDTVQNKLGGIGRAQDGTSPVQTHVAGTPVYNADETMKFTENGIDISEYNWMPAGVVGLSDTSNTNISAVFSFIHS